ncbi:hypothetical protein BDN67DRAFT_254211 [Paxillus ammoniavirescens]|nr:hypothetical protein BDN67DRAFT_254211 [Paxillus ammoniavirescens]
MDSGLPQSKSVPSILSTGRPHRVSISGSGSYQSHLSSVGSLHRVRTTSEQAQQPLTSVDEKLYLHALESGLAGECRPGQLSSVKYPITDPLGFLADDFRRIRSGHIWRLRTILTLYCCLSVVFLSVRIHAVFREALRARPQSSAYQGQLASQRSTLACARISEHAGARTHGTEPLQPLVNISVTQRLSVAFPNLPPPAHLDAFVVQAHYHQSGLTACLWIEDFRITAAFESASAWPGSFAPFQIENL